MVQVTLGVQRNSWSEQASGRCRGLRFHLQVLYQGQFCGVESICVSKNENMFLWEMNLSAFPSLFILCFAIGLLASLPLMLCVC